MKQAAREKTLDLVGWIGTGCILIGYAIFSTNTFSPHSTEVYHTLNLIGSIGVAMISYHRKIWQPFVINATFAVLAAIALLRIYL